MSSLFCGFLALPPHLIPSYTDYLQPDYSEIPVPRHVLPMHLLYPHGSDANVWIVMFAHVEDSSSLRGYFCKYLVFKWSFYQCLVSNVISQSATFSENMLELHMTQLCIALMSSTSVEQRWAQDLKTTGAPPRGTCTLFKACYAIWLCAIILSNTHRTIELCVKMN